MPKLGHMFSLDLETVMFTVKHRTRIGHEDRAFFSVVGIDCISSSYVVSLSATSLSSLFVLYRGSAYISAVRMWEEGCFLYLFLFFVQQQAIFFLDPMR